MRVPDFDQRYAADPDPWRVRSSFYETRKLEIVLASLARPSYAVAWDTASGVGELAARLSGRADRVLASDGSRRALELTRERCADLPQVTTSRLLLPDHPPADWPAPDLVVIAEFWYYLDPSARAESLRVVTGRAAATAELMSVHWRHRPDDAYLSGAEVQQELHTSLTSSGWTQAVAHDEADFVLASYTRTTSGTR